MKETGLIYCITNKINNKKYIGLTTRSLETRKSEYFYYYENELSNTPIFQSMKKYDIDNFEFSIIERDIPNEKLDEKEQFYIKKYNSFIPNGYNATHGGRIDGTRGMGKSNVKSVYRIDPLTYDIIDSATSLSEMARKMDTYAIRISDVCRRKSFTAAGYIYRFTDDYSKSEVENNHNKKFSNNHIPVRAFYIRGGGIIGEYNSIYEAHKALKISTGAINEFCQGLRNKAGMIDDMAIGFEYINNNYENIRSQEKRNRRNKKQFELEDPPIEQYNTITNETIATYNSFSELPYGGAVKKYIKNSILGKTPFTIKNEIGQDLAWRLRDKQF